MLSPLVWEGAHLSPRLMLEGNSQDEYTRVTQAWQVGLGKFQTQSWCGNELGLWGLLG